LGTRRVTRSKHTYIRSTVEVKVKVKFIIEQAMKAQRGKRGIDLLVL